jgi:3-hydroxyisobutyrate dehydrogenase-like beta-hydroxyacid dehydrogenase
MTRVGFIGLGQMGKAMALNLVGEFDLMVYDPRAEPCDELAALGVKVAGSPAEVARHAEVTEIAVVDDLQLEQVTIAQHGVLETAAPGSILAVHSTVRPSTVKKIAGLAARKSVEVVDAPVSGGDIGAREHRLCYMVGGNPQIYERCRPIFATSGGASVFYLGELGMGLAAKLCHQVITSLNRLSAYEGMSLARRAGLEPESLKEVIRAATGWSRAVESWSEARLPAHHAEMLYKDLHLAIDLANELGIALPTAGFAQQWYQAARSLK